MTYHETIEYLFNSAPLFQNVGGEAYKEGLANTLALDAHLGHPHRRFRTVHIAGTNGKGSCSHTIAAILQASGLKVGLFTSPHLVDFRERIRVDGRMVSEEYVVAFVERHREFFEPLHPSFFELTTAMAFAYFAEQQVDVAVVEVGLGGRLDCTNIIRPEVAVITNISFDHVQFLGDTLAKIAAEKAGIIKPGVPVVVGEADDETRPVFEAKARREGAPIVFAEDSPVQAGLERFELKGFCQKKNYSTIMHAVECLRQRGFDIGDSAVAHGLQHVCEATGLMGRWQTVRRGPEVVCDTGHNTGGFRWIVQQLADVRRSMDTGGTMRIVFGMVNDKDITGVLRMMPRNDGGLNNAGYSDSNEGYGSSGAGIAYYFTQASVKRAMPCADIQSLAAHHGLHGNAYATVAEAYAAALADSRPTDFIYVGGSSFVVADFLSFVNIEES